MIPFQFRSKMGKYDVELHGDKVKASIVDDPLLIAGKTSKLKSSLDRRVMGLDFKISSNLVKQLVLCTGNRCLIISKSLIYREEVRQLLSDDTFFCMFPSMPSLTLEKLIHELPSDSCSFVLNFTRLKALRAHCGKHLCLSSC